MAAIGYFRAVFLLLPAFTLMPVAAASAKPSLAEAIAALDGKYRSVPDVDPDDSAPKIEAGGSGDSEQKPEPQEISKDSIKAALSYVESKSDDGESSWSPVVTVFADGREVAKLEGDSGGLSDPPVSVQIAELDPSNSHPEVVVSFYTGGAHCCSDTSVVLSNADGTSWTTLDVGEFNGGPLLAVDINRDGRYEFELPDDAFYYAFACYACSAAPLQVLAIDRGTVKNVSREPAFRPAHEAFLKNMIEGVPEDSEVNGFLAGYVAEKTLLGEGKSAWDLMLQYYDKASDWGLETCDKPIDENGECPGQTVKLTFPEALERMLKENGYTTVE
jgi:hypothetical protein